ncbi:MAG: glycoside hydrolase [Lentisphaerae bacterium]|nr:glycoside hydrolase [Lentisphaerota bacterium]
MQRFHDGRDGFFEHRYGLFVHWGLYALTGWHEQVQWRHGIPKADYVRLMSQFNPVHFDPERWLDLMAEAGMQYLCITTKHHDGFCLWDSACTEYKVTRTPYGRDILAMLAEACQRRGIRLGLYYSCPDWHHPNAINLGGDHQLTEPNPGDEPDLLRYVDYVRRQITELATGYGPIACFFWDIPPRLTIPDLNERLRRLQPGIMINDRGFGPGDYATPERHVPAGRRFTTPTEACQSVGRQSWGWRVDEDYYSDLFLMQSLDRILAMDGNYLLNVVPRPDGTIAEAQAAILRRIGRWFHRVREAWYGAEPAPEILAGDECMVTRKGHSLYLHFPTPPVSSGIVLKPLAAAPRQAVLLNTGQALRAAVEYVPSGFRQGCFLRLAGLPVNDLAGEVPVVRLDFDDLPAALACAPPPPPAPPTDPTSLGNMS